MTGEGIYYAVATGIAGRSHGRPVRRRPGARVGRGRPPHARSGACWPRTCKHTWTASRLARSPAVVDAGIRAAGRDRRRLRRPRRDRPGRRPDHPAPRRRPRRRPRPPIPLPTPPTEQRGAEHGDPVRPRRPARLTATPRRSITDAFAAVDRRRTPRRGGAAAASTPTPAWSHRHLVLPLDQYAELGDFGAGQRPVHRARRRARLAGARSTRSRRPGLTPTDVDLVISATVTGLAVPSLEARIAAQIGLRPDVKRMPLFGLGCVAGAAGHRPPARLPARASRRRRRAGRRRAVLADRAARRRLDAQPGGQRAVRRRRRRGRRPAGRRAAGTGPRRGARHPQPALPRHRADDGLRRHRHGACGSCWTPRCPTWCERYLGDDVDEFLADHGLTRSDVGWWVCHPGGPKVIEALRGRARAAARGRPADLATRWPGRQPVVGVGAARAARTPCANGRRAPGSYGVLLAMGPGFCSELVLLRAGDGTGA